MTYSRHQKKTSCQCCPHVNYCFSFGKKRRGWRKTHFIRNNTLWKVHMSKDVQHLFWCCRGGHHASKVFCYQRKPVAMCVVTTTSGSTTQLGILDAVLLQIIWWSCKFYSVGSASFIMQRIRTQSKAPSSTSINPKKPIFRPKKAFPCTKVKKLPGSSMTLDGHQMSFAHRAGRLCLSCLNFFYLQYACSHDQSACFSML